jgi:hypothetical protein
MKLPLVASPTTKPLGPFRGSDNPYRFSTVESIRPVEAAPVECDEHDWVTTGNVHGDIVCTRCGVEDEHWTLAVATSEDDRY